MQTSEATPLPFLSIVALSPIALAFIFRGVLVLFAIEPIFPSSSALPSLAHVPNTSCARLQAFSLPAHASLAPAGPFAAVL